MNRARGLAMLTASVYAGIFFVTAASAAYKDRTPEVLHLQQALLQQTEVTAADDINADGVVDVFDLGILKKQISHVLREYSFAATEEYVKLTGRNVRKKDVTWLVQSGSAAEFTVTGLSATLNLAGDSGIQASADHRPRYGIYVDGELLVDKTMDAETETFTLWEAGEENKTRTADVKVILLSEAANGAIGVRSVDVVASNAGAIKPAEQKELCIEFIGDSITCAYGVEGKSSSESFKTTTENFTKSYAYLTAMQLNADYSAVCYSGHGIVSGYSSGDKNDSALLPDCYELSSKFWEHSENWDFSDSRNDVVVINLGTNDINYVGADPENRSQEFIDGYIAFLEQVREKNPDAYIICTMGTMGGEEIYALIEQAAADYTESSDDERVMSYASATQNQADGIGSDWHPSPITQQNSAYVLTDKICQALGMESSKIGLNLAADSVYTSTHNADSGANVYAYVNEYDKSFWLNVSDGGDEPADIEAIIPDIPLQSGCEYRLEFDYISTVDVEIPLAVRGASEHYSDSIAAIGEKQHYEETFTVKDDDENAAIVFQLGGNDYYNVTFSNIRLVKIK